MAKFKGAYVFLVRIDNGQNLKVLVNFCEFQQWPESDGACVFFASLGDEHNKKVLVILVRFGNGWILKVFVFFFPIRLLVFFESSNNCGFEACEKINKSLRFVVKACAHTTTSKSFTQTTQHISWQSSTKKCSRY
jgi:hypothetical protein